MKIYPLLHISPAGKSSIFVASILSILAPIQILAMVVLLFIFIDFILGVIVGITKRKEGIISAKIWETIWKAVGIMLCILLAHVLEGYVLTFIPSLYLANIFAGIACGADFWSIVTNLAILSNHPIFRMIKKWGKREIESKVGTDLTEELEKELKKNNSKNKN